MKSARKQQILIQLCIMSSLLGLILCGCANTVEIEDDTGTPHSTRPPSSTKPAIDDDDDDDGDDDDDDDGDDDKTSSTTTPPGHGGSGSNDEKNGDDKDNDKEGQTAGSCDSKTTASCEDSKIRKWCEKHDNKDGTTSYEYKTETCPEACEDGKCVTYTGTDCENPVVIKPGESVTESTNSGTAFSGQNSCSGKLKDVMTTFKLEIPELGFYTIEITGDSAKNWGSVLSTSCALTDEVHAVCDVTTPQKTFTKLMSPGDYYLFVAPALDKENHFKATVKLKQTTYETVNLCGQYAGSIIPVLFDENGVIDISGRTSTGSSIKYWDSNLGCSSQGYGGKENAYIFSLNKAGSIKAELNVTTTENAPAKVAIYLEQCKSGFSSRQFCKDGAPDTLTGSMDNLSAGEYILFVDSEVKEFDYTLRLTYSE